MENYRNLIKKEIQVACANSYTKYKKLKKDTMKWLKNYKLTNDANKSLLVFFKNIT